MMPASGGVTVAFVRSIINLSADLDSSHQTKRGVSPEVAKLIDTSLVGVNLNAETLRRGMRVACSGGLQWFLLFLAAADDTVPALLYTSSGLFKRLLPCGTGKHLTCLHACDSNNH